MRGTLGHLQETQVVVANRLRPLLSDLKGPKQVGFMPGREAKDNVIKALLFSHAAYSQSFGALLLSTDAENAFVRVSWDYMLAT